MPSDALRFARLLDHVLSPQPSAFALLHRPEAVGRRVELLLGDVSRVRRLSALPLPNLGDGPPGPRHELLAMVPYRQVHERGFSCHNDHAPLLALTVAEQSACPLDAALGWLPDAPVDLADARFDLDDEEYASIVRRVLEQEIGHGVGANFVIKRSFTAEITGWSPATALSLFRRLLGGERGAYWTFVVHTGERTFVGATPERHVSLFDGTAVMNPISGTLRYGSEGPTLPGVMRFLADAKEAGELHMVVDEELKMMARICEDGGQVVGPYLKEMATLAHTEYLIKGRTDRDVREILRETMFAPTVTGSPLKSACRVIHKYEPRGRGYYSGVAALVSRDINGSRSLDSAILLRTADIIDGRLELSVGATLVRDSNPRSEVAETWAKAQGMLRALSVAEPVSAPAATPPNLGNHPQVRAALEARNGSLSPFWFNRPYSIGGATCAAVPAGRRVLVVDVEDTFTAMIAHQLRALGLTVDVCRFDAPCGTDSYDLVVMGPGPGDPRDLTDPRIAFLRSMLRGLLDTSTPFLAVCLSHQVLGILLGFDLVRRECPNQGVQKEIDFFGRRVLVGFYNTFALRSDADETACTGVAGNVEVSREAYNGQVHGLRGPGFRSLQFHAESVLSRDGLSVLAETVADLLAGSPARDDETVTVV
ncbi:anthranilate synthase family protein [Streptomyces sp. SID2888]|uniref:anthranilate synthase family protein n=1 Tax=Streptomyces sp. SID2888 TaxID=2690256 RepID=UPI00137002E4|nr:anthranilate synthase family protein [Streptomyces sp. SID2888]MYV49627.1 phenazine-specific anthranilate synthase component I [Streptomyces sp. SID2888]